MKRRKRIMQNRRANKKNEYLKQIASIFNKHISLFRYNNSNNREKGAE